MLRLMLGTLLATVLSLTLVSHVKASDDHAGERAIYEADVLNEEGHATIQVFDLSKPEQAHELSVLLAKGRIERIRNEHIPPVTKMFSLRWDLGLWSIIIFGSLLFILSKTAWPAMLEGLKKREQNIADAIAAAENARNESEKTRLSLAGEMAKANDNIRSMMEEARKDASAAKDDMLNSAKKEIAAERDRHRREIETAKDQALLEIWNQSTQLAAMLSAKTIKREIRPEDHKKLFDESLKEMKAAAAGKAGNS